MIRNRTLSLLLRSLSFSMAYLLHISLSGQILDSENKITLTLKDGTPVTLYGQAVSLSDSLSKNYYYLPCNLRLSQKKDGTPEFLFLKFTTEEKEGDGAVQGALLHMLMQYGLTPKQEQELSGILKSKYNDGVLKGMADVEPDGENSVRVISATLSSSKMTQTLVFSGTAPTMPGSKIALAAMLDKNAAQLLAATFEKTRSITDLSMTLSFNYNVRYPAARGYVKEYWHRVDSMHLIDSASYSETDEKDYGEKTLNGFVGALVGGPIGAAIGWFASGDEDHFSYDEMRKFYRHLEEKDVIEVRFEENLADERIDKIREAFFQHFLNSFTEKDASAPPRQAGDKEREGIPDIKQGDSYKFRREIMEVVKEKRTRFFNMNYALAVKRSHQLTENLASWYDGVKNNSRCVGVVNLNDPFFQHRDINLIMDLDAEDMIGKEINYATVSVRKKRNQEGANDFSQQITLDRKFIEENGNRITLTYSKAQDQNPDVYEYKVQWSLRGGHVFPPKDTSWTKGDWQGLTLSPPIQPQPMRFEVDLDEMKSLGIRNVTLQLRYLKFGKEVESNINISLYKKEPFAETTIYMDKNTQGYAYRLVFSHQSKGVLAMPWEASINTNYVFAVVPEELRKEDPTFLEQAIAAGKTILGGAGDGKEVKEGQGVLDKFKDLIITN